MPDSVLVLLVMEPVESRALIEILRFHRFQVLTAGSCGEARQILETRSPVEVVIGGASYRDGNWCDLLRCLVEQGHRASLVVAAGQADDRFWSEVLWRGAYDLLVEPYEGSEVCRVVESAARASSSRLEKVVAGLQR